MKEDELNEFGHGLLHKAVIHNRVNELARLLNIGYDINQQDELGFSPLHLAALLGRNVIIRFIIFRLNRNKDQEDDDSESILQGNNKFSNVDRGLLENIKINNLTKRGQSALHLAAKNGHCETVELLLKLGCDTNILDCSRKNPLDIAKKCKHESCIEIWARLQCKGTKKSYRKEECYRDDNIDGENMQSKNLLIDQREASNDVCHRKHKKMLSSSDSALYHKRTCTELNSAEYTETKSEEKLRSEVRKSIEEQNDNFSLRSSTLESERFCEKWNSVEYTETKSEKLFGSEVRKSAEEQSDKFSSSFSSLDGGRSCEKLNSAEYTVTNSEKEFSSRDNHLTEEQRDKFSSSISSLDGGRSCEKLNSAEYTVTKSEKEFRSGDNHLTEEQRDKFSSSISSLDGGRSCEKLNSVEYTVTNSEKEFSSRDNHLTEEQRDKFSSSISSLDGGGSCEKLDLVEFTETESKKKPGHQDRELTKEQNDKFASRSSSFYGERSYEKFNSVEYTENKSEGKVRSKVGKSTEEQSDNSSSRSSTLDDERFCKILKSVEHIETKSEKEFRREDNQSIEEQIESYPQRHNAFDGKDPCEELKHVENPDTKITKLFGNEVEEFTHNEMAETVSNNVHTWKDETGIKKSDQSSFDITKVANLGSETEIDRSMYGVFPGRDHNYKKRMEDHAGKSKMLGWSRDNTLSFEKHRKQYKSISLPEDVGARKFKELNAVKIDRCWPNSKYLSAENELNYPREYSSKTPRSKFTSVSSCADKELLLCDKCCLKRRKARSSFRPSLLMGANESVAKQPASDAWEVWELNNNRDDRKRDWNSPNRLLKRNSVDSSNGVLCKTRSLPELWNRSLASRFAWHRWKSIDLGDPKLANDFNDGSDIANRFTPDKSLETSQQSGHFGYDSEERVNGLVGPINSQIEIKIEDLSCDLQTSTQLEGIDLPIMCNNSTSLLYSNLPDSPLRLPDSPLRLPESPSRLPDSPLRPRQELPNLFCDNIYQVHSDTDIFRRQFDDNPIYGSHPRAWSKSTSDLSNCHLEESIDYFPCKDDSYLLTPKHGCYDWGLSIEQTGDSDRNHLTVSMKSKDGLPGDDLTYSYICSENEELEGSFVCHDCGTTVPQISLNKSDNFDGRIFDQKDIFSEGIDEDEFVLICSAEEKEILKEQPDFDEGVEWLSGSEYGMRSLFQEGSSFNAREHHGAFGDSKKYEYRGESINDNGNEDWRNPEDFIQGNCDGQIKVRDLKEGCLGAESNDTNANCASSSRVDVSDEGNNEDVICESMQRRYSRFSKQDTIFEEDSENESEAGSGGCVESCEPTKEDKAIQETPIERTAMKDQHGLDIETEQPDSDDKSTEEFQLENDCEIIDRKGEQYTQDSDVISNAQDIAKLHILGIEDHVSRAENDVKIVDEKEGFVASGDCDVVRREIDSQPFDVHYNVKNSDEDDIKRNESPRPSKNQPEDVTTPKGYVKALDVACEDVEIRYATIIQQWCEAEETPGLQIKGKICNQADAGTSDSRELSENVKETGKSLEIFHVGVVEAVGLQEQGQGISGTEGTEHLQGACKSPSMTKQSSNLNDKSTENHFKDSASNNDLTEVLQNYIDGPKCQHNPTDGFAYGCLHCSYERGISDSTNDSLISADTGIEVDESVADIDEFNSLLDLSQPLTDLRDGASSRDMTSTPLAKRSTRDLVLRDLRNGGRVESSGRVARNLMIDIDQEEKRKTAEDVTREKLPALVVSNERQFLSNRRSNKASTAQEVNISTDPSSSEVGKHNLDKQTFSTDIETIADIENTPDIGNDVARKARSGNENERKCTILSTISANEHANISSERDENLNIEKGILSRAEQRLNTELNKLNMAENSLEPRANIRRDFTGDPDNGTGVHLPVDCLSTESNADNVSVLDEDHDNSSSSSNIIDTANIENTLESALDIKSEHEERDYGLTEADGVDTSTGRRRLQFDFHFDENNNSDFKTKLEDLKDGEDSLLNDFKSSLKNTDKETIIFSEHVCEDQIRVGMFVLNFEEEGNSASRRRTCKHANDNSDEIILQSCCIEVLFQERANRNGRTIYPTKITSCFNFTNDIETVKLTNCLFLKDARTVALILIRIAESSELDSSKERFAKFVCHQVIKNALCSFDLVINWLLVFLGLIKSETKIQIEVDVSTTLSLLQTLITQPFFGLPHTRQLAYIISQPNTLLSKHNGTRIQFLLICLDLELRQISFSCKYPFRTFATIHSLLCYLQDNLANAFKELDKQFISCLHEENCLDFVSDVLIYLGLLKSEHPVNTTSDLGTCLRLLDHIVQQKYFPSMGAFLLTAFLRKPNELFETCEVERMQLLKSLAKIEDC